MTPPLREHCEHMNGTALFELLAAICALLAAIFIFDQHLHRPRPHKLMWTLGLLFYGLAAGADFLGALGGWTVGEYKAWYYFGGVLTAAFLGLGSLYLLAPRRSRRLTSIPWRPPPPASSPMCGRSSRCPATWRSRPW